MGGYKSVIVQPSPEIIDTYLDVSIDGVWIGYWIIDHFYTPLGTTSNYSTTANLHNSQNTTTPGMPFKFLLVVSGQRIYISLTVTLNYT
jgi:hypothetical protein